MYDWDIKRRMVPGTDGKLTESWETDWWFGTMEFYDFPTIFAREKSSQLTFTPWFFRGVAKNHQPGECGNIVEWLSPRFRTPMVLWTITTSDGQFPFSATGQLHLRWTMEDVPRCLGTYNIYSTWFCLQNVLISLKSNGFTVSSSLLKWPYWGDKSTICRHRKTHHGLHPVCLEDKLVRGRGCSLPIICWFLYP